MSARYPTGGRKPYFRQTVSVSRAAAMSLFAERTAYATLYEALPANVNRQASGLMPELRTIGGEVEDFIHAITGAEVALVYGDRLGFDGKFYTVKRINPIYDYRGELNGYDVIAITWRNT